MNATDEQLKKQMLVPIVAYIRQLEQLANQYEWEGDLDKCDAVLADLQEVRLYQLKTGSLFYPMF